MTDKQQQSIQNRDTCLALTFLLLLVWFFYPHRYLVYAAMALLLVGMISPKAMRLPARCWFGLSHVLGAVVSKVVLTLIYALFLFPVGIVRRAMGKDAMRRSSWHNGEDSAFVTRAHTFGSDDLTTPY